MIKAVLIIFNEFNYVIQTDFGGTTPHISKYNHDDSFELKLDKGYRVLYNNPYDGKTCQSTIDELHINFPSRINKTLRVAMEGLADYSTGVVYTELPKDFQIIIHLEKTNN